MLGMINRTLVHDETFQALYLLPMAQAIWFLRLPIVLATSFLTGVVWISNNVASLSTDESFSYRNAIVSSILVLVIAVFLSVLRQAYKRQKTLASTDYLTDTANRRAFHDVTHAEILRSRRYGHPFTLAYVDVDNFKAVNDAYGHEVGDQLLKFVCDIVKDKLRETDTVARLGGDEFALLLPETGYEAAKIVIQKIQQTLRREMKANGWTVTFSIGVVTCLDPPSTVDEVIKWGDDLAYMAKKSGKDAIKYDVIEAKLVSVGRNM